MHPAGQSANLRPVPCFAFASPRAGTEPLPSTSACPLQAPLRPSVQFSAPFLQHPRKRLPVFKHLASPTPVQKVRLREPAAPPQLPIIHLKEPASVCILLPASVFEQVLLLLPQANAPPVRCVPPLPAFSGPVMINSSFSP